MNKITSVEIGQLLQLNIDLMDSDEDGQDRWTRAGEIGRIESENCGGSWTVVFANGAAQVFDIAELNDETQCCLIANDHPGAAAANAAIDAMEML